MIEEKRRTSMLSFSDTMALALDILKRNTGLRQYFKTRYKYIMIDEFQDNNSLQRDLLFLLAERNDLCIEGRIPETDELEKGKLFFVGDEKQSIYLFRGADVSVFRSLQDDISSSGGRSLRLSTNYRSCRCLIDHFNTVFRSVFASSEKDYEARFEETRAGRAGDEGGSVSLLAIDRELAASRYPDLTPAEAEAENVALLVERMLTGDEFLVRGRRPQETDIAILFARSGNQVSYELALKRRGISYQVGINKSLMQQAVSGDFYSLLQSIVYPDDRIALAASLRGPFARLSDRAADQILSSGPESLDGKDRERYKRFSAFRDRVAEMIFAVPVAQVLSYMYYEGGYFALLSSREDYLGFEEHFEYLLSYAESYEKNGGLTSFLSFLRSNLGSQDRIDETRVLHEKKQGVQIMTVHAAKGLEFPIVIVASSASRPAADRKNYVFSYKGRLIAADDGALYKVLDRDRQARQEAESMRTLYVALTRAECHLVVSGTVKLTAKGGLDGNTAKSFARYLDAVGYDPAAGVCRNAKVKVIAPALSFARELTEQAVKGEKIPMPGRTHTQLAMPSSLGLWFSSYSSELADEVELLLDFYSLIDQCPLGSAASYGVPLPLDRKYTAGLLGFSRVQKNVLYANNSRGKFEAVLLDICSYMSATACKLAQDLILFTLPELGYFSLPAELTTGSSIMPQKKNPDGLELVRSRSALVQAQSTLVKDIIRSLVSGYNRDFQDTKEPLMTGVDTTHQILAIMSRMTGRLVIHEDRLRQGMRSEIYATDKVFEKVREGGTFRDSYKDVGLNLDKVDAEDADEAIAKRTSYGTSGCLCLDEDFARISAMEADVRAKREKTDSAVRALTGQSVNLCGLS